MNPRFARWLLKCYPRKWQVEYGKEFADLLRRQPTGAADIRNVLWSALKEHTRQPRVRFLLLSLLGCGCVFGVALVFADPVWRFLSSPVAPVLRSQGIVPPRLIAGRPMEQLEVVFLGIPLLLTALAGYPGILGLAWNYAARIQGNRQRRLATSCAVCSATLFFLSVIVGFTAWQHGSLARLLAISPDFQNSPMVSVSHCFALLAASTLGLAMLPQIPVWIFYSLRFGKTSS
jgi:Sec-independent protein secretion pathway component TatC